MSRKEPEEFQKVDENHDNKIKNNIPLKEGRFELRLVVIGILLTVYWQILPEITQPIFTDNIILTFILFKLSVIIVGALWFLVFLLGTNFLAYKDTATYFLFEKIFPLVNSLTLLLLFTTGFIYVLSLVISL